MAVFALVLRSVRYENILRSPNSQPRQVVFAVSDGTSVAQATAFLSFDLVNDPPMLDLNGPALGSDLSLTFHEGSLPLLITSQHVVLSDVDSPLLEYVSIQLTGVSDEGLEGLSTPTISSPELEVTDFPEFIEVRGPASPARFVSLLSSLSYFNHAEEPTEGERKVLFLASDGEANSTVVTSTIAVQLVNGCSSAPVKQWLSL